MVNPLTYRQMMLQQALAAGEEQETYWELLRRRYSQVESDGRLNWYLRVNEADHLALSLPGIPEVDLFNFAQDHGSAQLNILPVLRGTVRARQTLLQKITTQMGYKGSYLGNAYAGKANDSYLVAREVVSLGDHYETSAPSGVVAAMWMNKKGVLPKGRYAICNGYFNNDYARAMRRMRAQGFETIIPVLDKPTLLEYFTSDTGPEIYKMGVRRKARHSIASSKDADRHESPFGMRFGEMLRVAEAIHAAPNTELVLYHMHLGTQIEDEEEFLTGLRVGIKEYCELRQKYETLHIFDIGGGIPVAYSLAEIPFNLERFWVNFLRMVQETCRRYNVPEPDILTEWGRHTVSPYEMRIWRIIDLYDHRYQLDGTIMGSLPDYWGIGQNFLVLPASGFERLWGYFSIRGLTCDEDDEYIERVTKGHSPWQKIGLSFARCFGLVSGTGLIPLPVVKPTKEDFFVVFCETGAYQEMIGQMEHCLQPEKGEYTVDFVNGQWEFRLTKPEETSLKMLKDMGFPL